MLGVDAIPDLNTVSIAERCETFLKTFPAFKAQADGKQRHRWNKARPFVEKMREVLQKLQVMMAIFLTYTIRLCELAYVSACVRACVRVCVRSCVRACVRACVRTYVRTTCFINVLCFILVNCPPQEVLHQQQGHMEQQLGAKIKSVKVCFLLWSFVRLLIGAPSRKCYLEHYVACCLRNVIVRV